MTEEFKIVIPARYDSSRFPGKPLVDIHGKPMIQRVYEAAVDSGASEVVIATDSTMIGMAAEEGTTTCRHFPPDSSARSCPASVIVDLLYPGKAPPENSFPSLFQ